MKSSLCLSIYLTYEIIQSVVGKGSSDSFNLVGRRDYMSLCKWDYCLICISFSREPSQ